jgi:hypothetical protein
VKTPAIETGARPRTEASIHSTRADDRFEEAMARWRAHLAECQRRRPRIVLEWGEEAS